MPTKRAPKLRFEPTRRIVLAFILALALILVGATLYRRLGEMERHTPATGGEPGRTLTYWVEVQKYRNGKPDKDPLRLASEMVFQVDDRVWFYFNSPQPGYLYIINEGPEPLNNMPQYIFLFPTPTANNNSSELSANQTLRIPGAAGFKLDDERGTEKIWIVWSAKSVDELEGIAREVATPARRGVISDSGQTSWVQAFITTHQTTTEVTKDELHKQTTVKGDGNILVILRQLEHY